MGSIKSIPYFIFSSQSSCAFPSTRREWRSRSQSEKNDHIGAVQCLRSQPSRVRYEGVLYDDFPFIHNQFGGYCKLNALQRILGGVEGNV